MGLEKKYMEDAREAFYRADAAGPLPDNIDKSVLNLSRLLRQARNDRKNLGKVLLASLAAGSLAFLAYDRSNQKTRNPF